MCSIQCCVTLLGRQTTRGMAQCGNLNFIETRNEFGFCLQMNRETRTTSWVTRSSFTCVSMWQNEFNTPYSPPPFMTVHSYAFERHNRTRKLKCVGKWSLFRFEWMAFYPHTAHTHTCGPCRAEPSKTTSNGSHHRSLHSPHAHTYTLHMLRTRICP